MAIVATGGYGRGLMAPGSDIDLLFLLPYKQTAWGESVAEAILYCLWDLGLKVGHATRSIDECIRQAKADMTIRTAILESRFLLGDRKLFDELMTRFDKSVVQGTGPEFVAAKLAEREERHRRAGQSRYLVEPNVKDGKGGLRDLHTLFWIAKYVYRVRDVEDLVERGVFDEDELKLFRRCEDFLWSVRCNMHFLTGRAEERLSFDIQREIAVRLGYTEHPGLKDVERFMKHYFLIAKDVGDLTAILCAELEDRQAKPAPVLSRMMARLRPRGRRPLPESDGLRRRQQPPHHRRPRRVRARPGQPDPDVPARAEAQSRAAPRRHARGDAVAQADRRRSCAHNPEANRLFLEILTSHDAEIVLRRMNETGVLGRFVRAFGRIVAMMQFNMYHHYTVDEHLLRCIGVLADIERGSNEEFPLANDLMQKILPEHRTLLYVAMFLHDIAKGRIEDHSIAGARIARRFLPAARAIAGRHRHRRLAGRAAPCDVDGGPVARPVRPQDHREFRRGGAVAGTDEAAHHPHHRRHPRGRPRRLERLEGPASAHALLRNRAGADRRLLRGQPRPARCHGAGRAQGRAQGLAGGARSTPTSRGTIRPIGSRSICRIASRTPASCAPPRMPASRWPRRFAFDAARGVTELTVLAPDHPWLLSTLAGACAAAGANIVDAQIFTTTDGRALDTIAVSREFDQDEDEARRAAPHRRYDREGADAERSSCRRWWRAARRQRRGSRRSRSSRR